MGQSILTPYQRAVLGAAANDPEITLWYYFTGGTALSEFYLHHRFSEDLDFFTDSQVNDVKIDSFIEQHKKEWGVVHNDKRSFSGLFMYDLTFADETHLKLDFNEYEAKLIEKGKEWNGLRIDSFYDIAINKMYTVTGRGKSRDFVDLYFCLETGEFDMNQLIARVTDKFGVSFEDMELVRKLNRVSDVTDYPTMLVPFDRQKMIDFFLSEAKKLEHKIFT